MSAGPTSLIGTILKGKYRADSVLGEGGMGIVYRGTDITCDRAVAVKTLQPSAFHSAKTRERFQREATLANRLNHPGIARVLDFGIEEETPYLIMELVEGVELTEVIDKEGPQLPSRAIVIMRQLIAALGEAHANNMVHRDIKPSNLKLLGYVPGGPIVLKVLDFGLAKEIGQEQGRLTSTGAVMGTPLYLAPEQAMDSSEIIDGRADQYAAGVVFYELLAGHVPFQSQSVAALLMSHVAKPPPPLPKDVPEPLRRIVMRMLSKSPADRFPDDAALDQALAACEKSCASWPAARRSDGSTNAAVSFALPRANSLTRRSVQIGGGVGVFVIIIALCGLYLRGRPSEAPREVSPALPTGSIPTPAVPPQPPSSHDAAPPAVPPAPSPPDGGVASEAAAASPAVRRPASGKSGGKKGPGRKSAASAGNPANPDSPPPQNPFAVPVAR